jgi:hypothetical protein
MASPESHQISKRALSCGAAPTRRAAGLAGPSTHPAATSARRPTPFGWALRAIVALVSADRQWRPPALIPLLVSNLCLAGACKLQEDNLEGGSSSSAPSEQPRQAKAASVQQVSRATASTPGPSERWAPYPPGRWRLVPPKALEPVVIWASQILVRHAQAADEESFSFAKWKSVAPPVARTRAEALALAREIADQARRRPEQFAELARQYSEDITNREQGGSLAGLRASQLLFWPQVLDAFAAIRPGEVSEPVETRFGFHVFLRQAPPVEEGISGQHIVISHDRVTWSRMATCKDELPTRTREQALSLATTVFQAVQAQPESFPDAVQKYSEDCDVAVGGDFGSWSTREVAPFERRLEVLRSLAPGETAPPRETHVGFEIIRRTHERPRQRFAAELISVQFDPWAAASQPTSRENALRKATDAARELKLQPARFTEFQSLYCCSDPFLWEEGREPPGLRSSLESMQPGDMSPEPVRASAAYMLARKLDPVEFAFPAQPMAELELPSAQGVALETLLVSLSSEGAGEKLSQLSRDSAGALGVSPDVAGKLSALLGDWASASESLVSEQREAQLESALEASRALLDDSIYARYRAALEAGITESVLSRRLPMF